MKKNRVPQNPDMRSLLIDFTTCDLQRPLRRVKVNWEQALLALQTNRITGLAYHFLRHSNDPNYPPPEFKQAVRKLHYMNIVRMAIIYKRFKSAVNQLQQYNIDFLVLKGPAVAYMVAPDPSIRYFSDLDLMVRECDWSRMNTALLEMGYLNPDGFSHPPPKIIPQAIHHETKYYYHQTGFVIDAHYGDLLHDGLAARDIEGFWNRAVTVPIEGVMVKSLCLEDQLLHLCGHAHKHGFTHLCFLADLLFILRDHANQLDWDLFLRTVTFEQAQVPVYYSLRLMAHLFGISPPIEVLKAVQPDGFRRGWHECYMPEDSIDPMSNKKWETFSFKERPLFRNIILNLFVMGRRTEKLHYLLRLLFPPPEWIRFTYGLPDNRLLAPYYVMRPFKLIFTPLGDIIHGNSFNGKPQP